MVNKTTAEQTIRLCERWITAVFNEKLPNNKNRNSESMVCVYGMEWIANACEHKCGQDNFYTICF